MSFMSELNIVLEELFQDCLNQASNWADVTVTEDNKVTITYKEDEQAIFGGLEQFRQYLDYASGFESPYKDMTNFTDTWQTSPLDVKWNDVVANELMSLAVGLRIKYD